MTITKDTKAQLLFIDFPNIGEIIRPITLDFITNKNITIEYIANKASHEVNIFIQELENYINDESETNYKNHTKQNIAKTIQDYYLEDLKDELPVLNVYIKKITKKYIKDENLYDIFAILKSKLEDYTSFLEDTLHPLINKSNNENVEEALVPYDSTRVTKEKEIVDTLYKLRAETHDFVSTHEDVEVDFIYNRLEYLEQLVSEMIILEQLIGE